MIYLLRVFFLPFFTALNTKTLKHLPVCGFTSCTMFRKAGSFVYLTFDQYEFTCLKLVRMLNIDLAGIILIMYYLHKFALIFLKVTISHLILFDSFVDT